MSATEITFEILKIAAALAAAGFAYFKFFREGSHKQRIESDLDCRVLGAFDGQRIVEIGCTAENKGNVEQRFDDIRVVVRGIENGAKLSELKDHAPRLAFPKKLATASLISERWKYYFVRPKVKQRFPLVLRIPAKYEFITVRSTFRYQSTTEIHSAERAFMLNNNRAESGPLD